MDVVKNERDFQALARVVPNVDLSHIYLQKCTANRTIDALSYGSVKANISFTGALINEGDDGFEAMVSICLVAKPDTEEEKEVVRIESEFILKYVLRTKEGLTTDDIKVFCNMNSLYNAWPYWRELVHNMANRMETPVPPIPLLKFKPKKSKKKKEKPEVPDAG